MKKLTNIFKILTLLIVTIVNTQAQSGSDCPNLDFSQGTFNGWICKTSSSNNRPSTAYNDLIWSGSNPVPNRHTIMTNIYGYDQHTCNGTPNAQLSLVPNGFNQSARVGNDYTLFEADAIVYRMTVDTNNVLMLLHFGVVFNDIDHSPYHQPCFEFRIQDTSGNFLNFGCNHYFVVCDAGIPGFIQCSPYLRWRDWTIFAVDLYSLIGQTIDIVISTSDCGEGGHYGYAYVVGECSPKEIQVKYCESSIVARLEAPNGFVSYVWRDSNGNIIGNNQRINVLNPVLGSQYSVTMQSVLGCTTIIDVIIDNHTIDANFTCDSTSYQCYPSGVTLTSNASTQGSKIISFDWTISKISGVAQTEYYGTDSVFTYFFKDSGYYKITHTAINKHECTDTSSVIVYSNPNIDVNINATSLICKNTETEITASGADTYEWTGIKRIQSDSSAIIDQAGIYIVKGINAIGCAFDTVEINEIDYTIQFTSEDNNCFGDTNGKINITGIIGDYVIPMKHYWKDLGFTNGASLSQRNNLPAGSYVVYSIDDMGCFRYDTIIINDGLPLGNINPITGDSIIQQTGYYNYTIDAVQEAHAYHWWADEIALNGNINLLDTITINPMIVIPILNSNSIELNVMAFNTCDSSDTSSLTIQMKNNIIERIGNNDLSIFPNPTSDQLSIQSKHGMVQEITLFDVVGKEVLKQSILATECTISLNDLHNGLYFIRIKTENALLTYKILKK